MNTRFWKAVVAAWGVSSLVNLVIGLFVFKMPLELATPEALKGIATYYLLLFLAVYIMAEFLEKLARGGYNKPLKYGLQFGVFYFLPIAAERLFYLGADVINFGLDSQTMITSFFQPLLLSLATFAIAAIVYSNLDA